MLNLVGVANQIQQESWPLEAFVEATDGGEVLASSLIPASWKDAYGQPGNGVRRTVVNLKLRDSVIGHGVDVRYGYELQEIHESEECVRAVFKNGEVVEGDVLIGCDGIKSRTRAVLQQWHKAQEGLPPFTGLSQTAGISLTPEKLRDVSGLRNWYGSGVHVIAYPVSTTHTSWAITLPESEQSSESWKLYPPDEVDSVRARLRPSLAGFDGAIHEMLDSCERIVKFGLFDRPELQPEHWYSRRCVLVGDAAHPTSPHLGQGANQSLEDCFHLSHAFPDLTGANERATSASVALPALRKIFADFANKRAARTALLVKGARANGERRVVTGGFKEVQRRNEDIRQAWSDSETLTSKYDALFSEPFPGVVP